MTFVTGAVTDVSGAAGNVVVTGATIGASNDPTTGVTDGATVPPTFDCVPVLMPSTERLPPVLTPVAAIGVVRTGSPVVDAGIASDVEGAFGTFAVTPTRLPPESACTSRPEPVAGCGDSTLRPRARAAALVQHVRRNDRCERAIAR